MPEEAYAERKLLQDIIAEEFDIKPSVARAWITCMEQDAEHPPTGLNSTPHMIDRLPYRASPPK
jgi:hypothetical protein